MKYIQSFAQFESTMEGVFIPKGSYSLAAQSTGKKNITAVDDEKIEILKKNRIFQAMEKKGEVKIYDVLPDAFKDAGMKNKELSEENKSLKAQLASKEELEQEVIRLREEVKTFKKTKKG